MNTCPPQKRPFLWGIWTPSLKYTAPSAHMSLFPKRHLEQCCCFCRDHLSANIYKSTYKPTARFEKYGTILQLSYDNCQSYDRLTTDV